jgi:ABC-type Na+ efflux pump permease subunit
MNMNVKQSNMSNISNTKEADIMSSASSDFFKSVNEGRTSKKVELKAETTIEKKPEELKQQEVKKQEEGGLSGSMISLIICLVIMFILSSIGASVYYGGSIPKTK